MKYVKTILMAACMFALCQTTLMAEDSPTKVTGKIFSDWHYDLTDGKTQESAFSVMRTYFGLKHKFSDDMSAKLTYDIDYKAGDGQFTAYLKAASLKWKLMAPLTTEFGLIGYHLFNTQEKFWGYRYIYGSFQDVNKFGNSAEQGLTAAIKPHKMATINISVTNGDGYKTRQDSAGYYKLGGDVILNPIDALTLKLHYNMMPSRAETQSVISTFAGYKVKDMMRVGVEYNMITAKSNVKGKDLAGASGYVTYIINKQFEVFGRGDWLEEDKTLVILGLQYAPVKGVKIAPNFQLGLPEADGADPMPLIAVNAELNI